MRSYPIVDTRRGAGFPIVTALLVLLIKQRIMAKLLKKKEVKVAIKKDYPKFSS